jgi:GT2 family glycosyltransferase
MPEELVGGLYYEDTWLGHMAREKGFSVVYQPIADLTHHEGSTRTKDDEWKAKVERNKRAFLDRWYSR